MNKFLVSLFVVLSLCSLSQTYDIDKLLERMTIEDKCGQMTQITLNVIEKSPQPTDYDDNPVNETKLLEAIKDIRVGSILNTPYNVAQKASTWQKIIEVIQKTASESGPHKIPVLYGIDSIHGGTYIQESILFPQPLGMAATFNVDIASRVGEITALETRATGIPWNFNPVFDMGRQPLWPRLWETYGEDVYLASKMGEYYIKGSQGNNMKDRTKVATCMKHYIGYSFPFNGRDRTPALIPENLLREVFLPPFAAGVKAGSPTVMVNSAEVNGIPGHANGYYINDILKGELNFEGFVVSDWEDIIRLHTRDYVAETPEEAVRISVMAGLDMSMVPFDYSFYYHCVSLGKKNENFLKRATDATRRILKVKDDLGLFENNLANPEDLKNIDKQESHDFNLEAARESIILAKNKNNLLPLDPASTKKILVTGPSANILRVLNGGWSYKWQGDDEHYFQSFGRKKYTILESINKVAKPENNMYSEGVNYTHVIDIDDSVNKAKTSDIIILCIGEDTYIETFGNINDLYISESQTKLAQALLELDKPTIVVYLGGRPRIMTDIAEASDAVLIGLFPGNRGGEAIADILFGKYNPNGRLPITYPKNPNGFSTYDYKPIEVFNVIFINTVFEVNTVETLFPFGHGLSYTKFTYSPITLDKKTVQDTETLSVRVDVKNDGDRDGKETVILYLRDVFGSVSRPIKQVKRFEKIYLAKGETKQIVFTLNKDDFSFIGQNNKKIIESGDFHIFIGNSNETFYLRVVEPLPTQPTPNPATNRITTPNSSTSVFKSIKELKFLLFVAFFLKTFNLI